MIAYIVTHEVNKEYASRAAENLISNNIPHFFVYGHPETISDVNSKNLLSPFFMASCEEAYENLALKTFYLCRHFLENSTEEYLLKMDDDAWIDVELLKSFQPKGDYIGMFLNHTISTKNSIFHWYKIKNEEYKVQKPVFEQWYAEGGAYILSRKAAQAIVDKGRPFFVNTPSSYAGEDVKVGMVLSDSKFIKQNLMENCDVYYEMSDDGMLIHPVALPLFNKLNQCSSLTEKKDVLRRYQFINPNVRRDVFLEGILKERKDLLVP